MELALLLPAMLTVLLGTMEYGWYFGQQMQVAQAARIGARWAAMSADAEAADTKCEDALAASGLPADGCTVTPAGDRFTVSVDVAHGDFGTWVPVPSRLRYEMDVMSEVVP